MKAVGCGVFSWPPPKKVPPTTSPSENCLKIHENSQIAKESNQSTISFFRWRPPDMFLVRIVTIQRGQPSSRGFSNRGKKRVFLPRFRLRLFAVKSYRANRLKIHRFSPGCFWGYDWMEFFKLKGRNTGYRIRSKDFLIFFGLFFYIAHTHFQICQPFLSSGLIFSDLQGSINTDGDGLLQVT